MGRISPPSIQKSCEFIHANLCAASHQNKKGGVNIDILAISLVINDPYFFCFHKLYGAAVYIHICMLKDL